MTANESIENARAAREAREAAVKRGAGPSRTEDAMKRYLASESFHAHRVEEQDLEEQAGERGTHEKTSGDDEAGS